MKQERPNHWKIERGKFELKVELGSLSKSDKMARGSNFSHG